jgi:hypothetical protein
MIYSREQTDEIIFKLEELTSMFFNLRKENGELKRHIDTLRVRVH